MLVIFDSGIGGFSILRELIRENINCEVFYLCDQVNFPYGSKSEKWLKDRLNRIASACKTYNPQAFVIACNTGTVAAISDVRQVLDCPVIGVEPVVKPLAKFNKSLVLATVATVSSARMQELVNQHGSHILAYTPANLAMAIENNDNEQVKIILEEISGKVNREKIEAIGLSCTHYPLIIEQFRESCPRVEIYDPSQAVVSQIKKVLGVNQAGEPKIKFQTTGGVVRFNQQIKKYFGDMYRGEQVNI